jgi:hypothetical protein
MGEKLEEDTNVNFTLVEPEVEDRGIRLVYI